MRLTKPALATIVLPFGLLIAQLTNTAYANITDATNGEHATEVDISQPIEALDNLTSLKNTKPLNFTLPDFQHFTTTTGVPVIFFQTNQLPIVDVDIRFNAGSARDGSLGANKNGLASLVADQLTKGTLNLDETEFAEATEQLGIELESASYKDQFVVSLRSLSDAKQLNPALDLLSDVLSQPRFDENVLQRSKAQHVLGLKQLAQNPAYIASTTFSQALYVNHPYAHASYGTINTVPKITVEDLKAFHKKFIVAQNASISITGDLTLDEAKKLANMVTKQLPQGNQAAQLPTPKPNTGIKHVHIDHESDQTTIIIGQLGYAIGTDPKSLTQQTQFNIGNEILAGSGFNSRLMSKIRQEMGFTYGIYGSMAPMQTNGPYTIKFSTRNDKAEQAIKETLKIINDTINKGVTEDEFKLTKESMINSYPMGFASNANINQILGMLNFNKLPDSYIKQYVNRIENTTLASVNNTLKQTISPSDFVIVTVGSSNLEGKFDDWALD